MQLYANVHQLFQENDPEKWQEIEEVSIEALKKRIGLWNSIESIIVNKKVLV